MLDEDRALRAFTHEILGEIRPDILLWVSRPPELSGVSYTALNDAVAARLEPKLQRVIPRMPRKQPTTEQFFEAMNLRRDVVADPALLDAFDPTCDPVIIVRNILNFHKIRMKQVPGTLLYVVTKHYASLINEIKCSVIS